MTTICTGAGRSSCASVHVGAECRLPARQSVSPSVQSVRLLLASGTRVQLAGSLRGSKRSNLGLGNAGEVREMYTKGPTGWCVRWATWHDVAEQKFGIERSRRHRHGQPPTSRPLANHTPSPHVRPAVSTHHHSLALTTWPRVIRRRRPRRPAFRVL